MNTAGTHKMLALYLSNKLHTVTSQKNVVHYTVIERDDNFSNMHYFSFFLIVKLMKIRKPFLIYMCKWLKEFRSLLTQLLSDMTAGNLTVNIKFT